LGGEVYVVKISDDSRRWEPGSILRHQDGRELVVDSSRAHRDRFLVTFRGIGSRTEAEQLRGALYVADDDKRTLEEDEYWLQDLIGARVETITGEPVGEVIDVLERPAQDLLVVSTSKGERYIPMVKEIVPEVDVESKRVTVSPPEGLLD
jgi:16S rRNA processing protein RimM